MTIPEEFEKQMSESEFRQYHWKRSLAGTLRRLATATGFGGLLYGGYGLHHDNTVDIAIGAALVAGGIVAGLIARRLRPSPPT